MTGVVTTQFRLHNAEQLFEGFSESSPFFMYLFIGKSTPWDDDSSPPDAVDTIREADFEIWKTMVGAKRVITSSVSYVAPRYDWSSGTVYAQYKDNSSSVWANNYFVLTDDFNVYKCLDNNSGAQSTVKPTGSASSSIITSDGYVWKFMYSITPSKAISFLTKNYIPVQVLTANNGTTQWDVQQAAVNGSIGAVEIITGGSSYKGFTGTVVAANSSSVTIDQTGILNGALVNSSIYISSGTGAGQLRKITGYNGTSKVALITPNWNTNPDTTSGYILGPTVTINGDGSNANAYAQVANGAISRIRVIGIGSDYTVANVAITANSGSGATAHAHIAPPGGHGNNAVAELSAFNVMVNVKLEGDESGVLMVDNEFRKLGIMVNPLLAANGSLAQGTVYDQTTRLSLTSINGTFVNDEKVTGGTSGATGIIVDVGNTQIRLTETVGNFSNGESITGNTSAATASISSIQDPALEFYTGRVLYYENRAPISRDSSQSESLSLVVKY